MIAYSPYLLCALSVYTRKYVYFLVHNCTAHAVVRYGQYHTVPFIGSHGLRKDFLLLHCDAPCARKHKWGIKVECGNSCMRGRDPLLLHIHLAYLCVPVMARVLSEQLNRPRPVSGGQNTM